MLSYRIYQIIFFQNVHTYKYYIMCMERERAHVYMQPIQFNDKTRLMLYIYTDVLNRFFFSSTSNVISIIPNISRAYPQYVRMTKINVVLHTYNLRHPQVIFMPKKAHIHTRRHYTSYKMEQIWHNHLSYIHTHTHNVCILYIEYILTL